MKIKDWYKSNKKYFQLSELNFILKSFGIDNLAYLDDNQTLNYQQINKLEKIRDSHLKGIPLAILLSEEEFFGNIFKLNQETLIPRPETEILVEKAKEIISFNNLEIILDLCTGSGNIGISLEKLCKGKLKIYLSDIKKEALFLAKENAINLQSKAQAIISDLFSGFKAGSFDLIISNPPYVESENIKGSLTHEPKLALDGGRDGLRFLKKIIENGHNYLKQKGYLILEIGYNQKEKLESIINQNNKYKIQEWIKDYANLWRGVVLQKK
ncbi:MAG: peptide chain release factor N(5)-glutamine methyltransferase [Candidatus Omnitrophica bacterium]|nr:peptide chain release factor N(5)-glutamine methyltransferase [Candidatus Omnitrophota bacterium]